MEKSIVFNKIKVAANERESAMETRDHLKNGASLKSHTSRGNPIILILYEKVKFNATF